jgi:hypothetical protein
MGNVFDILIKFGLSKEKASEAAQELKKIETQTKNVTAGAADLSRTQAELANNVTTTTKKVQDLNFKQADLARLNTLLPPQIRAIGNALRFAFSSPIVALAAALLLAVRGLVGAFREAKQRLDVLNLGQLNKDVGDMAGKAGEAAANWNNWRKAISDTGDAADDSLAKIQANVEAAGEVADAQFDLARAKVEADSSLTPEQKKQRLGEIDEQQSQSATNRGRELRRAAIAAKERQLEAARSFDAGAFETRRGLAGASQSAAGDLAANQQTVANLDTELARLDEKQKNGTLSAAEFTTRQTLFAQRAELIARQPALEAAASSSAGALSSFDQRAATTRASIPRLETELGGLRATDALRTTTEDTVGGLQARARRVVDPNALVANAAAGADAIRGGGTATADQSAAIARLTEMLGLQKQNQALVLQIFGRMNDNEKAFQNSLKVVKERQ